MPIDLREDGQNFVIVRTDGHGVETRLTISTEEGVLDFAYPTFDMI